MGKHNRRALLLHIQCNKKITENKMMQETKFNRKTPAEQLLGFSVKFIVDITGFNLSQFTFTEQPLHLTKGTSSLCVVSLTSRNSVQLQRQEVVARCVKPKTQIGGSLTRGHLEVTGGNGSDNNNNKKRKHVTFDIILNRNGMSIVFILYMYCIFICLFKYII